NNDEVTEQLWASVDFPVDLCDTISNPDDANFTNWSHQAMYFILGYEVEGHQNHLKLTEGHVEVGRLLTLYQACIHDFMFYGHSLIVDHGCLATAVVIPNLLFEYFAIVLPDVKLMQHPF
nr:protein multipolar spindle 1 isoform X2 [Tanacetum cinerariifolium]